mmetsp:Transcript_20871/g.45249  ORF Transcript_20871/g.45249 Transcript_20871/m.45249 type:complete len:210 (-) Transcript_20871:940-1569(-)
MDILRAPAVVSGDGLSKYYFFHTMPRAMSFHGHTSSTGSNGNAFFVMLQIVLNKMPQLVFTLIHDKAGPIVQAGWQVVDKIGQDQGAAHQCLHEAKVILPLISLAHDDNFGVQQLVHIGSGHVRSTLPSAAARNADICRAIPTKALHNFTHSISQTIGLLLDQRYIFFLVVPLACIVNVGQWKRPKMAYVRVSGQDGFNGALQILSHGS